MASTADNRIEGVTMNRYKIPFGLILLLLAALAHSSDELLAVAEEEQEAFREGDCDRVLSLMAEDITFYTNSRKMSREQIGKFCRLMKRPFGAGRAPISDTITPYKVSETLGYTVRELRFHDKDERVVQETVTKIWSKGDDGWKMIHFQATVLPQRGATNNAK